MLKDLVQKITEIREPEALAITRQLLEAGTDPMEIIESCSDAMGTVGERFEQGLYFLPQLMMAGEILQQVSVLVKPYLKGEYQVERKGRILMGTVKGDIHNIGKDIVTFLLDINGFEVLDLGVDIPPETFVDQIRDYNPDIVGMSGLLTIAFESMKRTVQVIEEAGLREQVKIMIGGGQMSENVCAFAGADAYAKDAMAGVRLAEKWIGNSNG